MSPCSPGNSTSGDSNLGPTATSVCARSTSTSTQRPRPFLGVHPAAPPQLSKFLRDQGYIVEVSTARDDYAHFIERDQFTRRDERQLVDEIERDSFPLLRFGRWPHGSRSALSVTGDIDALTIRDYAYRILGR